MWTFEDALQSPSRLLRAVPRTAPLRSVFAPGMRDAGRGLTFAVVTVLATGTLVVAATLVGSL